MASSTMRIARSTPAQKPRGAASSSVRDGFPPGLSREVWFIASIIARLFFRALLRYSPAPSVHGLLNGYLMRRLPFLVFPVLFMPLAGCETLGLTSPSPPDFAQDMGPICP